MNNTATSKALEIWGGDSLTGRLNLADKIPVRNQIRIPFRVMKAKIKMTQAATETKPEKLVYTLQEAAALLGLSTKSIARLIKRGKLRCMASVRHKRIPRSELERFLKEDIG